jgi:arylformamidase
MNPPQNLPAQPFHDISRLITPNHPNWPGDAPYSLSKMAQIAKGDTVNTAVLSCSTHTATHVDAPFHYLESGVTLERVPLSMYLGVCQVIHAVPDTAGGTVSAQLLERFEVLPPRVLFFTGQPAHWTVFPEDFTPLNPPLIEALAAKGVQVVGTDGPSVDGFTSKTLDTHAACAKHHILIIESLNLEGIAEGQYELICLPLSLEGADGSPARAILRPL